MDDLEIAIRHLFAKSYPEVKTFIGDDLYKQLLTEAISTQRQALEDSKAEIDSQITKLEDIESGKAYQTTN